MVFFISHNNNIYLLLVNCISRLTQSEFQRASWPQLVPRCPFSKSFVNSSKKFLFDVFCQRFSLSTKNTKFAKIHPQIDLLPTLRLGNILIVRILPEI